jgi:hypothetical protein
MGPEKLQEVRQNMMKPEAFMLRANTQNTNIGFEQVLDAENDKLVYQNNGAGIKGNLNNGEYNPAMDDVNVYQYAVPGNLGALK